LVGRKLGSLDGVRVGSKLGWSVEGKGEGAPEGDDEGLAEGACEGLSLGADEGAEEGMGVLMVFEVGDLVGSLTPDISICTVGACVGCEEGK